VTTDGGSLLPKLTVETRAVHPLASLLPFLDPRRPLVFQRQGEGIAGIGEALRLEFHGPDRILDAAHAWRSLVTRSEIDDPVQLSGSGLVAFGAFAFDAESPRTSVLIVPRVVIGMRDGVSFVTRIGGAADVLVDQPLGPDPQLDLVPGAIDAETYQAAVATAVARIRAGELRKVVLARDVVGRLPAGSDLRHVLTDLSISYPDTWTFAIDGFLGASPETLVRVSHGDVSARVLAGSIGRGIDAASDRAARVELATTAKELEEHRYALQSVVSALEPHVSSIEASSEPFALELPNLWHLASDIEATLGDGSSSLDLVAELHPTAAVAGTPTGAALRLIAELEPIDRGYYGGPVGWVDARGDGKWAVALRSAQVEPDGSIRAFAGAGILGDSDPTRELAETRLKFRPIVDAFGRAKA